jgi:hypothetical protein
MRHDNARLVDYLAPYPTQAIVESVSRKVDYRLYYMKEGDAIVGRKESTPPVQIQSSIAVYFAFGGGGC